MKNDLVKLLEAQDVDLQIDSLGKTQKEYPEQIEALLSEIENLKNTCADLERQFEESTQSRTDIETEIQAERETLTRKEKRLLETKTNKEYNAVQSEIEQARSRIDALETEDLNLMTKLDDLGPRIDEAKIKRDEATAENTAKVAVLREKLGSIESDRGILEQKRDSILIGVNKRLLSVYSRLRRGRHATAIATVNHAKYSCMGCFHHLPPQKVMEIRRCNTMISCESCGRILFWDDREAD